MNSTGNTLKKWTCHFLFKSLLKIKASVSISVCTYLAYILRNYFFPFSLEIFVILIRIKCWRICLTQIRTKSILQIHGLSIESDFLDRRQERCRNWYSFQMSGRSDSAVHLFGSFRQLILIYIYIYIYIYIEREREREKEGGEIGMYVNMHCLYLRLILSTLWYEYRNILIWLADDRRFERKNL